MVPRAVTILKEVDCIAAEDTRHSLHLVRHFDINTPLVAYHDHSSDVSTDKILARLHEGQNIALISDAGTPLISDPGYRLVAKARTQGISVTPVPGACALIAALSASGLPTDRFSFEGFLPAKQVGRIKQLEKLAEDERTLVYYEAPHRIMATLEDMVSVFGAERQVCLARELTKKFETFIHGTLDELVERVSADADQQRGEFVVMVTGKVAEKASLDASVKQAALVLLEELPPKKAAGLAARITGADKKQIYQWLVEQKNN
jgi:16S rRNA (cytidine1402-2'-O)-methyltransferase